VIVTAALFIAVLAIVTTIALAWRTRRRHREAPKERYRRTVEDIRGELPTRPANPWPGMFGSGG